MIGRSTELYDKTGVERSLRLIKSLQDMQGSDGFSFCLVLMRVRRGLQCVLKAGPLSLEEAHIASSLRVQNSPLTQGTTQG